MRQAQPDEDKQGHILSRIKVQSPLVQVQTLRTREIRAIYEYEIPIFFRFKYEYKEAFANEVAFNSFLDKRSPVPLHPSIYNSRRGP